MLYHESAKAIAPQPYGLGIFFPAITQAVSYISQLNGPPLPLPQQVDIRPRDVVIIQRTVP